jgi:signal transduction histidine kinase
MGYSPGVREDPLDFRVLFEQSPEVLLVLRPDAPRYTMVGATEARLRATHMTREDTVGKGLFEIFPDNPDDAEATGAANLRASLDRVRATGAPDTMAVQKYDIRGPDGTFEARYWSPKNIPVLSPAGEILYILHRVEDVTDLVRASELGEELRDKTREMEREVIRRSQELAETNRELRAANARLGELDTAKTAFFSNVSHEFRTPLTLMLGPLEDALADELEPAGPRQKPRLELAYQNALRLLKLVNALLDFSRLEAGRLSAAYAPLDLPASTAELAGMFQSAADRAGLRLVVDCPPTPEPAWVDRDMWEKVMANLLSNAFKFTFSGEIAVRLHRSESAFVLEVADTGVGIPAAELPRIFERFHRVTGVRARTHEGTGIGLSLVRELVHLHGGRIDVDSTVGRGTTFRVEIPAGSAHLPADAVSHAPTAPGATTAAAHALEAERWQPPRTDAPAPPADTTAPAERERERPRVLVVDDNPDLRGYVTGLLAPLYDVEGAEDGQAALDAVRARIPDIVVSDVMMPRLDGFGLVRALRADPETASLPVILLSARAGEEAAIDGLDAGSDDYLVKPFSARELIARVRTHVNLARLRRALLTDLEQANRELDAFSYSVSHDLRAPLRAVAGFSRALAEDYRSRLDERGGDYLQRIDRGVERMSTLIDAMLDLSRVSRSPLQTQEVSLSAMALEVVADLRHESPERTVRVDVASGLMAHGDRRLLHIVLTNLIGNAWKFTARREAAHIEVGWAPEANAFFVRDNGAGFDLKYAARLFTPFQRFHSAKDFEGTGVGLATVQRVIARHGGRVWAEAEPERGATFYFSITAARH